MQVENKAGIGTIGQGELELAATNSSTSRLPMLAMPRQYTGCKRAQVSYESVGCFLFLCSSKHFVAAECVLAWLETVLLCSERLLLVDTVCVFVALLLSDHVTDGIR